jgi:predicted HAD superfamily Cof-like phosphohydrolase
MKNLLNDVAAFHKACDVPILEVPTIPPMARQELRLDLISEEYRETINALGEANIVAIADGIADLIYVLVGTALEYGIPLDRVWNEVQRTNMTKIDINTGKVRKREDGKVLKPDGWKAPDIHKAVFG